MSLADDFGQWKEQEKVNDMAIAGVDPSMQYTIDNVFKDTATASDQDNVQEHTSIIDTAKSWLSAAPKFIVDQFTGRNVVTDIANKTEQWAEGAIAGGQEVLQENPYAFSQGEGLNEEQLALGQTDIANQAGANFYQETIVPAAFTAGLVKGAIAVPVMAGDLIKMMKEAPDTLTGIQTVAGEFSGYNAVKRNASNPDFFAKLNAEPVTTASELLPAFLVGKGIYSVAKGRIHPNSPEVKETVQAIVDADKTKQVNEALIETASKSKVLAKQPEIYEQIVADKLKDTPMETAYIAEETFNNYWTNLGIDPQGILTALGAKATEGQVSMPYAKYLAVFGKSEHAKALVDDVKFKDDGLTPNEAVEVANAVKEHYEPTVKEDWQKTQYEYSRYSPADLSDAYGLHESSVRRALAEGKPVPSEVLKDYPHLKAKEPVAEAKATEQGALPHPATVPNSTPVGRVIEPVTRREINDAVAKIVTTRIGRVGNKFLGIFKVDPEVARLKNYGDFDTLAHEVGHYLDKKLGIADTRFDTELIAGADKVWNGNEKYDQYTPAEKRAEGVAEFTRQYLINPAQARANFPDYIKSFENVLRGNKDMESAVFDVANKMQNWFGQSSEARARGSVSFGNESSKSYIKKAVDKWYKFRETGFDTKVELSRMQDNIEQVMGRKLTYEENAYIQARNATSSGSAKAFMLVEDRKPQMAIDALNKEYHGVLQHAVTMRQIVDGLKSKSLDKKYPDYLKNANCNDWHEAFSTLLVAKRQFELQEINPKYKGSMSPETAKAFIDSAPKELQDLTQKFYDYNDNIMRIAVDAEIIKQEVYDELTAKYKNYASMARDFSEGVDTDQNAFINAHGGKGIGNTNSTLKRLTEEGSTKDVIDPLETAIKNTYMVLDMAERNKAGQTLVKVAGFPGIGKYIEPVIGAGDAGKNIFTVMVKGEKQAFQTTPEIYRAVMSMNKESIGLVMKILSYPTGWLRAGATLTPDFVFRNLTRDTFTAAIYSKNGFFPIFDTARGFADMIGKPELFYEFKQSGAQMSVFIGMDRDNLQLSIGKLIKENVAQKYNPMEWLRSFSSAMETTTRFREFELARGKGKSIGEASFDAAEVTLDFRSGGTFSKSYNNASAFFNATMLGSDRLARAFWNDPVGFNIKAFTYITLPTLLLYAQNHDKEWYKELPAWQKNTCWIFKVGDKIVRIPKPFEPGIIYGSLVERTLDYYLEKDPKAVSGWLKSAFAGFAPNLLPTGGGPMLEWIANYSFFRDKNIVPTREKDIKDYRQFSPYTSEVAKRIGSAAQVLPFMDGGLSPRKIDNTIKGYTGSLGQVGLTAADYAMGKFSNMPTQELADLPVVKSLTTRQFQGARSVDDFYEKLSNAEKDYEEKGKTGHPPSVLVKLRKANEEISKLNKSERNLQTDTKFSPDEKRQKLDDINLKRLRIAQKALTN